MKKRWPWWLLIPAIAAAGILPFVLLEAGLRSLGYGYRTGFFTPVAGKDGFASNDRFGWRFFPPSMARVPVVSYLSARKDRGTYRIFILGDSAAMGIPEPAFSFGRMLRAMLENRYPSVSFEVVNTAMTAINSHVLPPIASDCARLEPDVFIVLAGNNEVVGPYGPGTVLAGYSPTLSLIRAAVWFKSTLTAQLMERELSRFRQTGEQQQWGGMAMFSGHEVTADDARLASVYRNFRANLESVASTARSAGAGIILSTVPVNLKDSPPFASRHRANLSAAELQSWRGLYEAGVRKSEADDCNGALAEFAGAQRLDPQFADLRYRAGRCLLKQGAIEQAGANLTAARDLDTLRFRADSEINRIIRQVAGAGPSIRLVDAEHSLPQPAGNELFYEHVHLRFAGNYRLAEAMLRQVEAGLPAAIQTRRRDVQMSENDVAAALGFTEWDRDKSEMEMLTMMQQPPFQSQQARAEQLAQLSARWASPDRLAGLRQHVGQYESALSRHPEDPELREILAELLSKGGDNAAAAAQYQRLIGMIPNVPRWHANLAYALLQRGELQEAQIEADMALRLDPGLAAAQFTMGGIRERMGDPASAEPWYEAALRSKPDSAEAALRLGVILGRAGRYREAVDRYTTFLRLAPGSASVESNIGVLLVKLGDVQAAVPHYREALRLNPNFPEAANNLGAALERLQLTEESIAYYRMALRLRPGFPEAQQHLQRLLAPH